MRRIAALVGSALCALAAGLLLVPAPASAQDPASVPRDGSFVDTTGRFNVTEEAAIEAALSAIREAAGVDVAVLVDAGNGRSVRSVAEQIVDAWQVGGESERGVLVYVATRSHDVRIEVGAPVQPRISPAEAERMLDRDVLPRFSDDRIVAGVAAAVVAIGGQLGADDLGLADLAGPDGTTSGLSGGAVAGLIVGGIVVLGGGTVALSRRAGRSGGGRSGFWSSRNDGYSSYDSSSSYSSSDYSSSSSSDSGGASGHW